MAKSNIALNHKSIITEFGDIYITGGVDITNKSLILDKVYLINTSNKVVS